MSNPDNRRFELHSGMSVDVPRLDPAEIVARPSPPSQESHGNEVDVIAESRSNSLIVRGNKRQLGLVRALITQLDVRPRLVELELSIVDISSNDLDTLGVDWQGTRGEVSAGFSNTAATVGQGVLTAQIGDSLRNFFLARIKALEGKGRASFVAYPKVLTFDKAEAFLDNSQDLFVKVSGFQDASLYRVNAGTSIRILPQVVDENTAHTAVQVVLTIGDDSVGSDSAADATPSVRRRTIATQARIDAGKSLLIAGFKTNEASDARSGVPWLSNIPLLGGMFRYSNRTHAAMERFYLLTPRLVEVSEGAAMSAVPTVSELPNAAAESP